MKTHEHAHTRTARSVPLKSCGTVNVSDELSLITKVASQTVFSFFSLLNIHPNFVQKTMPATLPMLLSPTSASSNMLNIPADLAPAHDCLKILVSLWRQLDFMWETTMKKNIRFSVVCNPYRVLCFKTRRTIKVAFSLHRMRDLTASPVAVSKSKPVCSHLHW